jgi:hypothetical protein
MSERLDSTPEKLAEGRPNLIQTFDRDCLSYLQFRDQPIDAYSNL